MMKSSLLDTYLEKYSADERWTLQNPPVGPISQAVIIPAYAEKDFLFSTLDSLARNDKFSREQSYILCVINNRENVLPEVLENNRQTMECLDAVIGKQSLRKFQHDKKLYEHLSNLADVGLKMGYVNAATEGWAMPQAQGGVGLARKIGMDMALRLLQNNPAAPSLIFSLDADTLVKENYLSAVRNFFSSEVKTAVVAYEHQLPPDVPGQQAMVCYEIFLRYWVLGLQYAQSPWAFHSIGSTMVTTTEAYVGVRGMNRRSSGEDFYFLQKLAKYSGIHSIRETRVFPSARLSDRVPFGTGKRIRRFLSGDPQREYLLYDPRIFGIIRRWLEEVRRDVFVDEERLLNVARDIHPQLRIFLTNHRFPGVWSRIRRNAKTQKTLLKQFNDWFGGFRTLKLVNDFTRIVYPPVNMFDALSRMLSGAVAEDTATAIHSAIPGIEEQIRILQHLRSRT